LANQQQLANGTPADGHVNTDGVDAAGRGVNGMSLSPNAAPQGMEATQTHGQQISPGGVQPSGDGKADANNSPEEERNLSSWFQQHSRRPEETTHLHGRDDEETLEPEAYELVIDNDSGTYRPNKDTLALLEAFLAANFVGLKVTAKACQDDEYQDEKKKRRKARQEQVKGHVYAASSSDLSSILSGSGSDADEPYRGDKEKGMDFIANPKGGIKGKVKKVIGKIKGDHGSDGDDDKDGKRKSEEKTRKSGDKARRSEDRAEHTANTVESQGQPVAGPAQV